MEEFKTYYVGHTYSDNITEIIARRKGDRIFYESGTWQQMTSNHTWIRETKEEIRSEILSYLMKKHLDISIQLNYYSNEIHRMNHLFEEQRRIENEENDITNIDADS